MAEQGQDNMPAQGPDCLDYDQLAALLEEPAAKTPARRHADRCPRCQSELALMRSFFSSEVGAEERPYVEAIVRHLRKQRFEAKSKWLDAFSKPWAWGPALAASAAALFLMVNTGQRPVGDVVLAPGSGVPRSQSLEVTQPDPGAFAWKPVSGAVRYHASISEVDRTILWEGDAEGTRIRLPRLSITPGKPLLFEVTALDQSASVIARSASIRFQQEPAR